MDFSLTIVFLLTTATAQMINGMVEQTSSQSPVDNGYSEDSELESSENWEYPPECKSRMTSTSQYPYFVSISIEEGDQDVDMIPDPSEPFYGFYRNGVILSKNYVLYTGSVCYDCTYIVAVGLDKKQTGGTRHKAEVIPYDKDWRKHKHLNRHGFLVLLRLLEPIVYSARAQPVKLPETGQNVKSEDRGLLVNELEDHEMIDQYNRTVLSRQDCNEQLSELRSTWPSRRINELPEEAEIFEGFICVVDPPTYDTPCFQGPATALFIEGHLAGIEHHTIDVPVGPEESVSFQVHHDIAHVVDFIKNNTDV